MKLITTSILAVFLSISFAQLQTKDAYISFFSEKESIKAENSEVEGSLDVSTGELTFTVSIEKFIFPNSMMQKHFNQEGVMNSIEFPKANYVGKIVNNNTVDYTADGEYNVTVKGKMTIKGVSKEFGADGKIVVKNGQISANASFTLDRFEYGVDSKENSVSQILAITVKADFK